MTMLDIAAELRSALAAPPESLIDAIADRVVARLIAQQGAILEPLSAILGCTKAAATMRIRRDPSLRALAIPLGRRWLFRRSEVLRLFEERRRTSDGGKRWPVQP